MLDGAAKESLERRHGNRTDDRCHGCCEQKPVKIRQEIVRGAVLQRGFDPFGKEGALEGIRCSRNQHQRIEERERDSYPARPYPARDPHRVSKCANKVDDERQRAQANQLEVHSRPLCLPFPKPISRRGSRQRHLWSGWRVSAHVLGIPQEDFEPTIQSRRQPPAEFEETLPPPAVQHKQVALHATSP
jgi:hypothetical protein